MYVQQLYTGCLAEAAYYIESNGEAAIIDPLRETEPYLALLAERKTRLKYVFETHFHADFVSGHIDLSAATGALIVFGPEGRTEYPSIESIDGQVFTIGGATLTVLHTPGHTPESACYLLRDEQGHEHSVFTGDTLFIGDVGRPDLAQKAGEITAEDMAATLYNSLRNKILPLPDHVLIYPAHGAGSACGKNMAKETFSTLGEQRVSNYALGPITREEFIAELTYGIPPAPQYFAKAAAQNKLGYEAIDTVFEKSLVGLSAAQVRESLVHGDLLLDTRHQDEYRKAHIKGSWFIGLNGQFAPWAGALIHDMNRRIVVIADEGREQEAVMRLARVGYSNVIGYLKGALAAWAGAGFETVAMPTIEPSELTAANGTVLDVRKPSEFDESHVENAQNLPLDFFIERMEEVSLNTPYLVHCKGGYRSMIAASILEAAGAKNVTDVAGGFDRIRTTAVPISASVAL